MKTRIQPHHRRRAAVAVLAAFMMLAITGIAMLVVDIGVLYSTKGDLQRTADASSLAAASALIGDEGLRQDRYEIATLVYERARRWALRNTALGKYVDVEAMDVRPGRHDYAQPNSDLSATGIINAVEVTVRRQTGFANGSVPLFFSKVFGRDEAQVSAVARAAFDDRVTGYRYKEGGLLPFTIHENLYNDMVQNGVDEYTYDDGVMRASDGIPEVRVFPWKESGGETNEGAGNFGTLNVGVDNLGTSTLEEQISNGISADDIESEFGSKTLTFHDADGPHTYVASGNTGMSVGMEDDLQSRIGDLVGFFIHKSVKGVGEGTEFELSGIRFGRIVAVDLSAGFKTKALTIQPVVVSDDNFIVKEYGESSGGQIGKLMLVR